MLVPMTTAYATRTHEVHDLVTASQFLAVTDHSWLAFNLLGRSIPSELFADRVVARCEAWAAVRQLVGITQ